MPLVTVRYREPVSIPSVLEVADRLPEMVAQALTCEDLDGILCSDDIDVEIIPMTNNFRTPYDLQITVEANSYPSREKNLDERAEQLRERLKRVLIRLYAGKAKQPRAFVWVRLAPASFKEI